MRRFVFAVATALSAVVGAAFLATGPATARADDNATVCAAAKKTIETGAQSIVTDLQQAGIQASQGNKAAADATVVAMGPKFATIGQQLQQVGNTATDANLKTALNGLGTEFTKVGQVLSGGLDSLNNLDETQLNAQGQRVETICGFTSPGASGSPMLGVPSASTTS